MVVVFDVDIYKGKDAEYRDFLHQLESNDIISAVTYPSYSLFMLLHREGAYKDLIAPNETDLLENQKVGTMRYIDKLFSEQYKINPKKGVGISELAQQYETAVMEERNLNSDPGKALNSLSSNTGIVIKEFLEDNADIHDE